MKYFLNLKSKSNKGPAYASNSATSYRTPCASSSTALTLYSSKRTLSPSSRAFTLIEILIVIGLSTLVLGISLQTFTALVSKQTIEKDTENVYAILQKARNQSVAGVDGSQFGVKFATTSVTLFRGTGYIAGDPTNQTTSLGPKTQISLMNLTGATSTIYFSKISGKPSATGTIEIILKSNPTIKEVITIHGSGLTEVQ